MLNRVMGSPPRNSSFSPFLRVSHSIPPPCLPLLAVISLAKGWLVNFLSDVRWDLIHSLPHEHLLFLRGPLKAENPARTQGMDSPKCYFRHRTCRCNISPKVIYIPDFCPPSYKASTPYGAEKCPFLQSVVCLKLFSFLCMACVLGLLGPSLWGP